MKTSKNYGKGIVSLDILDLNMVEVRQMTQMTKRIADVLSSHNDKEAKNQYLSDSELELIYAMLVTFTKDVELESKSAFDETLKEIKKSHEEDVIDNHIDKEL